MKHTALTLRERCWASWAEYQNEPLPEDEAQKEKMLSADEIAAKTNSRKRGEVPAGCDCLTAFIDVQQKLLFLRGGRLGEGLHGLRGGLWRIPPAEPGLFHHAGRAADPSAHPSGDGDGGGCLRWLRSSRRGAGRARMAP